MPQDNKSKTSKWKRKILLYIALSYAFIFVIMLGFWIYGFDVGIPGDLYSFGQFLVELILIPIVIYGFIMAKEELEIAVKQFKISQEKPDLDLYWKTGEDQRSNKLELKIDSRGLIPFKPELFNNGDAIAIWFMVQISIPAWLEVHCERLVGTPDNMEQKQVGDQMVFTFMSDGQTGAYPRVGLPLVTILAHLINSKSYEEEYKIPYTIITDRADKKSGNLILRPVKKQ